MGKLLIDFRFVTLLFDFTNMFVLDAIDNHFPAPLSQPEPPSISFRKPFELSFIIISPFASFPWFRSFFFLTKIRIFFSRPDMRVSNPSDLTCLSIPKNFSHFLEVDNELFIFEQIFRSIFLKFQETVIVSNANCVWMVSEFIGIWGFELPKMEKFFQSW